VIDIVLETLAASFAMLIAEGTRKTVFDVPDADEATHYLLCVMLFAEPIDPP